MAKKQRPNNIIPMQNGWELPKFIDMRLGKAEKDQFLSWLTGQGQHWFTRLAEIVESGYKLSLSYWFDGQCYIASLTCKEQGDPNYNCVLSSRSDDASEALAMQVFKHDHMCNDHIWEAEANDQHWG